MNASETWESVIGIETHCQLLTASKMFSDAPAEFSVDPNCNACEIDLGLPGVLPAPNRKAVEAAVRFGLAVGATVNRFSEFARKNYFYPDLPKGYQISQYEYPLLTGGSLEIGDGEPTRTVVLTRAHLEEDAGKLLHDRWDDRSGVDLNRAGVPLLEIVTEPDLRSAAEAVAYAKLLHQLVRCLGICDGNMQQGSFRCDVNVSIRLLGTEELGTRCEVKNLNSFRFLQQAIEYEIKRQIEVVKGGSKVEQETRLFDASTGKTRSMRSKEEAQDYRYFPDPDLLPLLVEDEWVDELRRSLPELPWERRARYVEQLSLSAYDASVLTDDNELANYFDALVGVLGNGSAKLCANWVAGEINALINRHDVMPAQIPISPEQLAGLLARVSDKTVSGTAAKTVLEEMWERSASADEIIESRGLKQINDPDELAGVADRLIEENRGQFRKLVEGKDKLLGFFVGLGMKATRGKADPALLNKLIKERVDKER